MSYQSSNNSEAELKQLWGGGEVPPLTKEQTELSLQLWRKIKKRRQREQQSNASVSANHNDNFAFPNTDSTSLKDKSNFTSFSADSSF